MRESSIAARWAGPARHPLPRPAPPASLCLGESGAIPQLSPEFALLVPASADNYGYRYGAGTHVITVSCYRGPWEDVIWDRPNPEFTDSLVSAGYSFPEAHAIAERVCRDPASVGQPDVALATMTNILRSTPPGS